MTQVAAKATVGASAPMAVSAPRGLVSWLLHPAGLSFSLTTDSGWAVGLMTSYIPRIGHLIWLAEPTFEHIPTVEEAAAIQRWRWPVLFPLDAAIRRKIVKPIGMIRIPPAMQRIPLMRSGRKNMGWQNAVLLDTGGSRPSGRATDPATPVYKVVNDTRLREMLTSGWRPENEW